MDSTDVRVLSALSDNPLGSVEELANKANLSPSGILKRIRKLVESGFLNKEFVRAQVDYPALGLEPVVVLVESNPGMWESLEGACDAHPYTQFRIRVMGSTNGFLLIFSVPVNSRSMLLEFLDGLKARGVVTKYSVYLPISDWGYSETRFSLFNPVANAWGISWSEWEAQIEGAPSELHLPSPSVIHKLDQTDVGILRALSINARGEKKEIAQKLGIKDYELSRRLRFLQEHRLVSFCRLVHETAILGIVMTVVIKCKSSLAYAGKVLNSANHLPFQGSIYPLQDGFLILANMPPTEVTNLVTLMQKHCESIELMWGDYNSSMKYFFDNDPTNLGPTGWITDRKYMIDAPIESGLAKANGANANVPRPPGLAT